MLSKLQKIRDQKTSDQKGFTIIEVMIVLAIAGLIILIVFLAVPALQRNSRNTQRKNDVSNLLAAVNEFTSNNSGALPTTIGQVVSLAKTGYYSGDGTGSGQTVLLTGTQTALGASATDDRVVIVTGAQCGVSGATTAGSARQTAIQYETEVAGGFTPVCQGS